MSKPQLTRRNEIFNQQAQSTLYESRYDLSKVSHGSFRMGVLYPIYCRNDIHPGDKWSLSSAPFLRLMALINPALTEIDVEVRYFFVPRRLVWSNWKRFISPTTSDDVALIEPFIFNYEGINKPTQTVVYNVAGSIYDYMGQSCIPWYLTGGTNNIYGSQHYINDSLQIDFPSWYEIGQNNPVKVMDTYFETNANNPIKMSAYPYLAYNLIWNEYFRDENLQGEAYGSTVLNGSISGSKFGLKRVNWQKDYFTSALPFVTQSIFSTPTIQDGDTIETLREQSALTKWLELQAIGGHRYQESILTHFGVHVPDEAAQVPIYLGGGKCPIQIGSVEQTTPASSLNTTPLATLGGRGTASDSHFIDKFMFKEHGTVLGLMYIRPRVVYADVTPKDLFPKGRHDYYYPAFANLGDEAVKCDELNPGFCELDHPDDDFGYQMRYASMRTSFDQVHGQLRPLESLESWTQARSWTDVADGTLDNAVASIQVSDKFIECKPSNRIFAVLQDSDNIVGDVITFVDAIRPLPGYVDPKID